MKYKIKNVLVKILLVSVFVIVMTGTLNAQRGGGNAFRADYGGNSYRPSTFSAPNPVQPPWNPPAPTARNDRAYEDAAEQASRYIEQKKKEEHDRILAEEQARAAAEQARAAEAARVAAEQARVAEEARVQREQEIAAAEAAAAAERARQEAEAQEEALRNLAELEAAATLQDQEDHDDYGEIMHFEVDTPYLAQELINFNAIFTGQQAPDMEAFNNLMAAFMGKEGSFSGIEGVSSAGLDLDPNMAGDYMLTSFRYHDERYDVSMEIARVIKVSECEIPLGDDDLGLDQFLEDYPMALGGIKILQETDMVTLAFNDQDKKVLLQAKVSSMKNYVIQKGIEGYVFLDPTWANRLKADIDNVPTFGLEGAEPSFARQIISVVADFVPYVGTAKAFSELIFGHDAITGEEISRVVAVFAAAGSVIPIPGAAKVGKVIGRTVTRIFGEAPDVIKSFPLKSQKIKRLSGPILPEKIANSFKNGYYNNRKLASNELYYRYHGMSNRTGQRFSWVTNKKYLDESSLRSDLAIREDWGIKIEKLTEFEIPAGTWVSEGLAAPQGLGYPGGGYQAAILEISKTWIRTTKQAFN